MVSLDKVFYKILDWMILNKVDPEHFSLEMLRSAIGNTRGWNDRTIDQWIKVLRSQGLLKENINGGLRFEIKKKDQAL